MCSLYLFRRLFHLAYVLSKVLTEQRRTNNICIVVTIASREPVTLAEISKPIHRPWTALDFFRLTVCQTVTTISGLLARLPNNDLR